MQITTSAPEPVATETGGKLRREFTLWSAFSLAFAYISPIVATYGVFALALPLVGPGYWLVIPVAVAGQLLVALVLGEVASRYPSRAASTPGRASCSGRPTGGSPAGRTSGRSSSRW